MFRAIFDKIEKRKIELTGLKKDELRLEHETLSCMKQPLTVPIQKKRKAADSVLRLAT
jgi:hypothetical protein